MGGNELNHVQNAFEKNWIAPTGPHIYSFEKKLSALSNGFEVAALSSGTASLHLALILLGVKKGDIV
ncbi:MAG: DegT/DnrJ/EryC1/StrS family aminotransferase, partial [Flavobacteriales bacterium]